MHLLCHTAARCQSSEELRQHVSIFSELRAHLHATASFARLGKHASGIRTDTRATPFGYLETRT